jgi:aminopeptidase N
MAFNPAGVRRAAQVLAFFLLTSLAVPLFAAERMRLRVDDYQIDAELTPHGHKLAAHARVKFTALEDLSVATFELNNGLRISKAVDANNKPLDVERVTQDSTARIQVPSGIPKGTSTTFTFDYEGQLDNADDSPVQGLKLAGISDDTCYLLYASRWFPVNAYGINRFTSTINVTVPAHMTVIGSGTSSTGSMGSASSKKAASPGLTKTFTYSWDKPSFPGTIIAGQFQEFKSDEAGMNLHVYFKPTHQNSGAEYASTAVKEFTYFITLYGVAPSSKLNIVELPDDTVPSAWAPEIAAIASRGITEKVNYRLLADTIAHQWWGASVSPATKDDWWLNDGFARYSEARYVESAAGEAGIEEMIKDMSVGALAYDTVPLSSIGKLDMFSPEFQSLVTDKGAMILHMLRWVVGDDKFNAAMRAFATQYAGKSATMDDFRAIVEKGYGQKLTWFFSQWLDSTGAPEFKSKYTIYRLGNNKGFRIVGEITQDLDLFRMPIDLKVDTDGKTENKRIEVVGTNSPFTVETFGRPRRIAIDPDDRVLKNSVDVKLRSSIMRGQAMVQQGDFAGALSEFNKALEVNKNSSLAHYRIADVFFLQKNYQAAANAYRDALNGDGDPKWTEVWCHVQLGKIFDITGQRDRATNEYRQAIQTNDNTQGAIEEARKYMQKPYEGTKEVGDNR